MLEIRFRICFTPNLILGLEPISRLKGETMKRILLALTSHDDLGGLRKTGFYVPEAMHTFSTFKARGYEVDFVSPKGGLPPMDGFKSENPDHVKFLADAGIKLEQTLRPDQVDSGLYDAIVYVGGHGTMWDFPNDTILSGIAASIYEIGGIVGAVCHGPAGLVNIRLSSGEFLVKGKTLAVFTDSEEESQKLTDVVPFLLESKLRERGANVVTAPNFQANVQITDRLITGQNPASSTPMAEAIVEMLERSSVAAV
jgi:putative intracellular protease/amidase